MMPILRLSGGSLTWAHTRVSRLMEQAPPPHGFPAHKAEHPDSTFSVGVITKRSVEPFSGTGVPSILNWDIHPEKAEIKENEWLANHFYTGTLVAENFFQKVYLFVWFLHNCFWGSHHGLCCCPQWLPTHWIPAPFWWRPHRRIWPLHSVSADVPCHPTSVSLGFLQRLQPPLERVNNRIYIKTSYNTA